jgi:hypothetical protein
MRVIKLESTCPKTTVCNFTMAEISNLTNSLVSENTEVHVPCPGISH